MLACSDIYSIAPSNLIFFKKFKNFKDDCLTFVLRSCQTKIKTNFFPVILSDRDATQTISDPRKKFKKIIKTFFSLEQQRLLQNLSQGLLLLLIAQYVSLFVYYHILLLIVKTLHPSASIAAV